MLENILIDESCCHSLIFLHCDVNSALFFHIHTMHCDIIKVFYSPTAAQVIVLKTELKFTLK